MKSLYAYFGILGLHQIDTPGHSLYQLGLIDSIRETYGDEKFDFYSYYPSELINPHEILLYPEEHPLGELFNLKKEELILDSLYEIDGVLESIRNKLYAKLYLKARFRNLSSLAKKWKDAREFEYILVAAIAAGYSKEEIIVLDTDLSLPHSFYLNYGERITILIPSIDFPGISESFLEKCVASNLRNFDTKTKEIVFYGNIDTSKYKTGNTKSPILVHALKYISESLSGSNPLTLIVKPSDSRSIALPNTMTVARNHRAKIWNTLVSSGIMLNITKDKYSERGFIPARIYEALIFGMVPISYKFPFLGEAFSFNDLDELSEIIAYLNECDPEDFKAAYLHSVLEYKKHVTKLT